MRKSNVLTISDRGQELTFKIREMPALQLERWIYRAFLLVADAGVAVPEGAGISQAGAFFAEHGLNAFGKVDYGKAEPLLNELLQCCSIVIDKLEKRLTPEIADDYISDVRTLFTLRKETLKLNLGFLFAGEGSVFTFPGKQSTETA